MAKTVEQMLAGADDSVTLINQINSGDFSYFTEGYTQAVVNRRVQENVDYLEIVLAMSPMTFTQTEANGAILEVIDDSDPTPDVAGSSIDKSSYTDAIATGKAYIADN
ncbi:hypothetical protein OAA77_00720 [Gammaproteobacteria bacterium]|nr:hypothetical protein [Gammaproteobacteria bacterium]